MREYIIQKGDTLSRIAERCLGDARRWPEIAALNHVANAHMIFVGQRLRLPDAPSAALGRSRTPGPTGTGELQSPASVALARGHLFIVVEQLPEVGTGKIIRKVAVIPRDFALMPANPLGNLTPAEHALNINPTQSPFLSASDRAFGAPSINGRPLLLDVAKLRQAGARIYSPTDVVRDLERFAAKNPASRAQVDRLISTIRDIEGEVLIQGGTPPGSASHPTAAHNAYIRSAEDSWADFRAGRLTRTQLQEELASLERAYSKARVVGRVGRVLMVVGVVVTIADVAVAAERSVQQKSFRPLGAEAVRQAGGWGGALGGAELGFGVGALFGIETGPGAIITGAIGALVFGAAGYLGADWVADRISPK
jgi:hypothetical protein